MVARLTKNSQVNRQIVVLDSEKCPDSFENFQFLSIFQYKEL